MPPVPTGSTFANDIVEVRMLRIELKVLLYSSILESYL